MEKNLSTILGRDDTEEVVCIDKFIGDDTLCALAERLKRTDTKKKKRIVLRGNCLGSRGASALADFFKTDEHTEFVSLEWNQVGSDGCLSLAEAIRLNSSLFHVDLRNNGITDEGAFAFANALAASNTTLKVLDLRWNQISDRGAEAFKDSIIHRKPALVVHLSGNNLTTLSLSKLDEWNHIAQEPEQVDLSLVHAETKDLHSPGKGPNEAVLPPLSSPSLQDEKSQSNLIVQVRLQNSILAKDIKALREQNIRLQNKITAMETAQGAAALQMTELEQARSRLVFEKGQLAEALRDARVSLAQLRDDQGRLVGAWELERTEVAAQMRELLRTRDAEIRTLAAERDVIREQKRLSDVRIHLLAECLHPQTKNRRKGFRGRLSCCVSALVSAAKTRIKWRRIPAICCAS